MLTTTTKTGYTCYHNVKIDGKKVTLTTRGAIRLAAMIEMYFKIAQMQKHIPGLDVGSVRIK